MIPLEQALKKVLSSAVELGTEAIHFQQALSRVLAADIVSDIDMPPFDKSAMDGYACRQTDLANTLEVLEVIAAGDIPTKTVGKNQCSKIMTGAKVPTGADTVIIVEEVEQVDSSHIRYSKQKSKSNICYLGEDVKAKDTVLKKGTLILPQHIPILASVGATQVQVYRQPKVAVISTGNELVEPDLKPAESQIRNSNAYSLVAQLKAIGIEANYLGICPDTEPDTRNFLQKATQIANVVIFSGAVSMGDFDFIPKILAEQNTNIHFHGLLIKPGKRTIFAQRENQYFFGVPGNPVSTFVQMEYLIKPFLLKLMGFNFRPRAIKLPLENDFTRKRAKRMSIEPVVLTENSTVATLEYHGSAHINALAYAHGFMEIPIDVTHIKAGEFVNVRLF